jgi:hypothetical protein
MVSLLSRAAIGCALAAAIWACAGGATNPSEPRTPAAQVDQPVVLAIGQKLAFEELDIEVELRAVEADSRCPSDVNCVWAGDAAVQVAVTPSSGDAQTFQLHTLLDPKSATIGEARVELLDLAPYPKSGVHIEPQAYRATLRVGHAR